MTQGSDQAGAGAGDGIGTPPAHTAAGAAAGAMTLGSILTVAGIILLFVFFALGIIVLQCCINAWDRESQQQQQGEQSRRRRRRGPRTTAGGGMRTRSSRGVDPELLRSLPVTVYHGPDKGQGRHQQDAAVECAVCLAELQDGEAARFLPRCGHGFHAECVDTWLACHTTCPLCRLTVSKPDDDVAPHHLVSSLALPPVPSEPANYAAAGNLPASSVLLGVCGHGAVTAGGGTGSGSTAAMVIEIPELAVPTPTLTLRDPAKSPVSARLRSIRRLWSFGRQGDGATSYCSCAGAGASEGVDLEQGIS